MSNPPAHHLPSPAASPFPPGGPGAGGAAWAGQDGGGSAPRDTARLRADLEAQLLRLSQDLYEMEVCAGEVGSGMEEAVPQYLKKISEGFVELQKMSSQVTDSVPRQVVEHVDKYKNPHQYTKTALSRATGENQYALGRVLGLELSDAIGESFPGLPLPERRHHPISSGNTANGAGNGHGEAGTTSASGAVEGAGGANGGTGEHDGAGAGTATGDVADAPELMPPPPIEPPAPTEPAVVEPGADTGEGLEAKVEAEAATVGAAGEAAGGMAEETAKVEAEGETGAKLGAEQSDAANGEFKMEVEDVEPSA